MKSIDLNEAEIRKSPDTKKYYDEVVNYLKNLKICRKHNKIYVSQKLIKDISDDKAIEVLTENALDFILCHEIGHILLNHISKHKNLSLISADKTNKIIDKEFSNYSKQELDADLKAVFIYLGDKFIFEKDDFSDRGGIEMVLFPVYLAFIAMNLLLNNPLKVSNSKEAYEIERLKIINNYLHFTLKKYGYNEEVVQNNINVMSDFWLSIQRGVFKVDKINL